MKTRLHQIIVPSTNKTYTYLTVIISKKVMSILNLTEITITSSPPITLGIVKRFDGRGYGLLPRDVASYFNFIKDQEVEITFKYIQNLQQQVNTVQNIKMENITPTTKIPITNIWRNIHPKPEEIVCPICKRLTKRNLIISHHIIPRSFRLIDKRISEKIFEDRNHIFICFQCNIKFPIQERLELLNYYVKVWQNSSNQNQSNEVLNTFAEKLFVELLERCKQLFNINTNFNLVEITTLVEIIT